MLLDFINIFFSSNAFCLNIAEYWSNVTMCELE